MFSRSHIVASAPSFGDPAGGAGARSRTQLLRVFCPPWLFSCNAVDACLQFMHCRKAGREGAQWLPPNQQLAHDSSPAQNGSCTSAML
ncbi:hypothetical protein CALCODRAFT_71894 [Calocera cornea HHB12733]|uniref:Uncharacterized protein n=1 Tax=Calocera cornea HHB12733 TaxID=1353952 RepID=A0A165ISP5_9BASI|nr:hypothetical protein CALCODRAFT_71894 [Calocera cornea HHB12733]